MTIEQIAIAMRALDTAMLATEDEDERIAIHLAHQHLGNEISNHKDAAWRKL